MNEREKELVIKWFDAFTTREMTEKEATEFLLDCKGDAEVAERVMRFIAIRYRYDI